MSLPERIPAVVPATIPAVRPVGGAGGSGPLQGSVAGQGGVLVPWVNVEGMVVVDSDEASVVLGIDGVSNFALVQGFGFDVPSSVDLVWARVELLATWDAAEGMFLDVYLYDPVDGQVGASQYVNLDDAGGPSWVAVYDGAPDGLLSAVDVVSAAFGCTVQASGVGVSSIFVDAVRIALGWIDA